MSWNDGRVGRIPGKHDLGADGKGAGPVFVDMRLQGEPATIGQADTDLRDVTDDIETVETVFKDGVGYDSAKLIDAVKSMVGQR